MKQLGMQIDKLIACIRVEPDKLNAKYVQVIRAVQDEDKNIHCTTLTRIPGQKPRVHKQVLLPLEVKGQKTPNFMITCDCERWMYMWEYAASLKGVTDIITGNGEPATETNPSNRLGICKHLFRSLLYVKQVGNI